MLSFVAVFSCLIFYIKYIVELLFFLYCRMEGFADYESLKQHAAWQCKLRLTAQYTYTKFAQNFQASISHGCNTFTILLILFSRTTGFYE